MINNGNTRILGMDFNGFIVDMSDFVLNEDIITIISHGRFS